MKNYGFIILLLSFVSASFLNAAGTAFFESEEIVSFRLEAPITTLKKQRGETEWLDGKVLVKNADGSELSLSVKIEARGNFRRRRSTCNFPPYWLNFKKSEVVGTVFDGLDKVKVVAHCNEGRRSFEPYMFTEYLAYKTYNILTDHSFQVRATRIEYFDTDDKGDWGTYGAFFIEHNDSFEARLNAKQVKDKFVRPSRYNHRELCIAEMFQYFAGNTDHSFFGGTGFDECCHNGKVFAIGDATEGLTPVPYDFDMSGLINAPYAEPNPNFPIESVRQRLYRGIGVDHKVLEETIKLYLRKKKDIYALWENTDLIDDPYRAKALDFIDEFYDTFKSNKAISNRIIAKLRHVDGVEEMITKAEEKAIRDAAEQ